MVGATIQTPSHTHVDLVVANHVIEHMTDPVALAVTLCRLAKPGGHVWIEAPSELSASPIGTNRPESHDFTNFWDDPTHVRPWTPGALYRLAIGVRLYPLAIKRSMAGAIPVVQMLARKPLDGAQFEKQSRYVTLKDVPAGAGAAFKHVWGLDAAFGD